MDYSELFEGARKQISIIPDEQIAGLVKEGRYMIPYLPEGVYADLRTASNMRFQIQSELTRIRNRISRWVNIFFPDYLSEP